MLEKISHKVLVFLFGVMIGSIMLGSYIYTSVIFSWEKTEFKNGFGLLHLVMGILLFILFYKIYRYGKYRIFQVLSRWRLEVVLILASMVWILLTQLIPKADQAIALRTAGQFLEGDFSAFSQGGYLFQYPNQIGLVLVETLIGKFAGNGNHLVLQFLNIGALVLIVHYLSKIYERFFGESTVFILHWMLLLFVPLIFYTTFVYGTMAGLACSLASLYYMLLFRDNKKYRYMFLSIALILAAVGLKMNYSIVFIAMLLFLLLFALVERNIRYLLFAGTLVILFIGGGFICKWGIEQVTGMSYPSGIPSIRGVDMGLSDTNKKTAPGWWWSLKHRDAYLDNGYDYEGAVEEHTESIKEQLQCFYYEPAYAMKFFTKKVLSSWTEPTFGSFWVMRTCQSGITQSHWVSSVVNGDASVIILCCLDLFQSLAYAGVFLWIIGKRRDRRPECLILPVIVLGGFLFHLFWETKGQYIFPYFVLLLPYAANGFVLAVRAVEEKNGDNRF